MLHRLVPILAIALLLLVSQLSAQETTKTEVIEKTSTSPKASIDDVKWITGRWTGEAMGGKFEETWNPPAGGTMMGMFKFMKDNQVIFYEILTIVPEGESLKLRLKHFTPELVGWEEKDKTIDFPLISVSNKEVKFDGLVFQKISQREMHVVVDMEQGEETKKMKFVAIRSWFNPKTATVVPPKAKDDSRKENDTQANGK